MANKRINVAVNNRTALLCSKYDYDKLIPYWSHSVANFQYMLRARPWYLKCKICHKNSSEHVDSDHEYEPVWDGKVKYLKRNRLPAGLFWATYKEIAEKEHIQFEVTTNIKKPVLSPERKWLKSEGEYSFQNECVDKAIKSNGGLILNATGSGKTRIAAMLASRYLGEVVFVVDQLVLLRQAREEIAKHLGEEIGYVGESKFKIRRVTVATIQTLYAHRADPKFIKWFKNIDVIIIDEIHDQLNKSNFSIVHVSEPRSVFGLTATLGLSKKPIRMRAHSLCGQVVYNYPVTRGMKEGVLSKGIAIILQFPNSLKNIAGWNREEAYQKRIVENGERNHLIARLVRQADKKHHYTITVVERLKHMEDLSARFDSYDIAHKVVAGTFKKEHIPVSERMKSKSKFESGKIRNLLVNKVFKKGIDLRIVDLIINASARPSVNDAIQVFGRGVRKHDNKLGLICIDIGDYDKVHKSKNWLHKAAKRRERAYKAAGIKVHKIEWTEDKDVDDVITEAEKILLLELSGEKKEIWKPIPSLDGYYDASSLGRVRRAKPGRNARVGKVCRSLNWNDGYRAVQVSVDSDWTYKLIHKLVMEAFVGPCPKGMKKIQVNHIDNHPAHNWITNLEYVTPKGNVRHSINCGTFPSRKGSKNGRSKLNERDVLKIKKYLKRGKSVHRIAKKFGVGDHVIYFIQEGKTWKHI